MTFIIRAAQPTDLDELSRLRQERMELYLKGEPRLQGQDLASWQTAVLGWMQHDQASVQVADRDGQLIGYMVGWVWQTPPMVAPQQVGIITEMSVDGHCKQGGVGTALLATFKAWFKAQNLTAIEIRVPRQHPIEQAFWRSSGAKLFIDHFYYRLD